MATTVRAFGSSFVVDTYVDPHPGRAARDRVSVRVECSRCGGSGIFRWWNAMGECRGTCFLCGGPGRVTIERAVSTIRREARLEAVWREHGDAIRAESAAKRADVEAAELAANYARDWDNAHAEQARRAALVGGFVAEVGAKITGLSGVVEVATTFEARSYSGYGTDTHRLVVIRLEDGRVVKCAGSAAALWEVGRGDRLTIKSATVKAHDTYQGQQQTTVIRPKFVDVVEAAPAP